MAVKNKEPGKIFPVPGVRMSAVKAGIRYQGRRDLVVFEFAEDSCTAGVFTRNRFCAAPVILCKKHLSQTNPRYFLVNTGNANAGTGEQGLQDALQCCEQLAKLSDVEVEKVLPFSTGVIGEKLPVKSITGHLNQALEALSEDNWLDSAEGIMTTDTRPKLASRQIDIDGKKITISGISKGAGMIRPDMATMLAFIATDARVETNLLQKMLNNAISTSFNRITVDGDTSTNDCCMLTSTGKSGVEVSENSKTTYKVFSTALEDICSELARAIVMDGEGASKFITIHVSGGLQSNDCLEVAYAVAHSPLVKTAFFASDPNWGRILAAVGRAPVKDLDVSRIDISLDEVQIVRSGELNPDYTEVEGARVMEQEAITIKINLNAGEFSEQVWTSDLSHDYVSINSDYRS